MLRIELQGAAVISGWVYNEKKNSKQMEKVFERQEENQTFVGLVAKAGVFPGGKFFTVPNDKHFK